MVKALMSITATITIKAQFYDCDPMDIVWHGNYPKYFEQARCELLDKIDFNYRQMSQTEYIWPIVDMRIKYVKSIVFGQTIVATATLVEFENRIRIDYVLRDAESDAVLTKGQTTQVAVHRVSGETAFESPAVLLEAVRRLAL